MRKVILVVVTAILISTTLISCQEECPIDEPTTMELLTAKEWNGINAVKYVNDVQTEDVSMTMATWAFMNNFDIIYYNNDNQTDVDKWRFLSNETQIELISAYGRDSSQIFDIDELTQTNLVLSWTSIDGADILVCSS